MTKNNVTRRFRLKGKKPSALVVVRFECDGGEDRNPTPTLFTRLLELATGILFAITFCLIRLFLKLCSLLLACCTEILMFIPNIIDRIVFDESMDDSAYPTYHYEQSTNEAIEYKSTTDASETENEETEWVCSKCRMSEENEMSDKSIDSSETVTQDYYEERTETTLVTTTTTEWEVADNNEVYSSDETIATSDEYENEWYEYYSGHRKVWFPPVLYKRNTWNLNEAPVEVCREDDNDNAQDDAVSESSMQQRTYSLSSAPDYEKTFDSDSESIQTISEAESVSWREKGSTLVLQIPDHIMARLHKKRSPTPDYSDSEDAALLPNNDTAPAPLPESDDAPLSGCTAPLPERASYIMTAPLPEPTAPLPERASYIMTAPLPERFAPTAPLPERASYIMTAPPLPKQAPYIAAQSDDENAPLISESDDGKSARASIVTGTIEPILNASKSEERFVLFPVKHPDIYDMYKRQVAQFWTMEEIDLSKDLADWNDRLSSHERDFFKCILAFFAPSDGIVGENLVTRFYDTVVYTEARYFYAFQAAMENIHAEVYSQLIKTLIPNEEEQQAIFSSFMSTPGITEKTRWAKQWLERDNLSFVERLVAFAVVEGLLFSGSFASIFWLKKRGLMQGLTFSNELISRDEGLHCDFACLLYTKHIVHKLPNNVVYNIVREAVHAESVFFSHALQDGPVGELSQRSMMQYVRFCADRLLLALEVPPLYSATNPFDFMHMISLDGRTNFFERRVGEYRQSRVLTQRDGDTDNANDDHFSLDYSF